MLDNWLSIFTADFKQMTSYSWEQMGELLSILWTNRSYVEVLLIRCLVNCARRGAEIFNLDISEDCKALLAEMQRIHYSECIEEMTPRQTYKLNHISDMSYKEFLETERTRIRAEHATLDAGNRFFYAQYPCDKAGTRNISISGCLRYATNRCDHCYHLYCAKHNGYCSRYMQRCKLCSRRRNCFVSELDYCNCGFAEIAVNLLQQK